MSPDQGPPPHARILQLATASWMSAAVGAAASLGVADALADGPLTAVEAAARVDADAPTLLRLLRCCTAIGLLVQDTTGAFALTDTGHALRSDGAHSMRNFARWTGLAADRNTWAELTTAVRTGRSVFEQVHGSSVWDYMRERPEVGTVFDDAMTEASRQLISPVVGVHDFARYGTVVDVAGGRGALLAAVLAANPGVRGVLYDQPEVVANAGPEFKAAGVEARAEILGGDVFASVPGGGDAYVLSNVIHDWDDEASLRILTTCRAAMSRGSRLLLVEAVMPEDTTPSPTVTLMDLNMLVLCDGKQRTPTEFRDLLARAGLELQSIVPAGLQSVVEATPARP